MWVFTQKGEEWRVADVEDVHGFVIGRVGYDYEAAHDLMVRAETNGETVDVRHGMSLRFVRETVA